MVKEFHTLADLMIAFAEPQAAIDHFSAIRWRNGIFCPYCKHTKAYTIKERNRYKCASCARKFSVMVGTIFENTKLPLRVWFGAMWLISNHKKGIASTTLAVDLGITQKTAWFLLHRLRHTAKAKSFNAPLSGEVEVDETYIGGKGINKSGKRSGQRGGHKGKSIVVGAIERGGKVVANVVRDAGNDIIRSFVRENVSKDATLISDMHPAYRGLADYPSRETHYSGDHSSLVHTNTIENVWSLLKRQIYGIHHWVSPKHLARYVDEMTWRLNRRAMTAEQRVNHMAECVEGRLTYKALIA